MIVGGGVIRLNVEPRFGVLKVGLNQAYTYGKKDSHVDVTYLRCNGTLELNGYDNFIANGCKIYVKRGGRLSICGNLLLQNHNKIHCANSITIGKYTRISWESQIFDTNMHYLVDENGYVKNNKGCILIGNNCWIGNRCTIQKGTILPDNTVVASNSVVNKDFTSQPYGILAGIPAKLIKTGCKRIFDSGIERHINKYFQEHPQITKFNIYEIDNMILIDRT